MNTQSNFTLEDVLRLEPQRLAEALNLLGRLASLAESHGSGHTAGLAHQAADLYAEVERSLAAKGEPDQEALASFYARHILQEAEEAFAVMSMAAERALNGAWPNPETVGEYLFWIEDEAALQVQILENLIEYDPDQRAYTQALRELGAELRMLGFFPAAAPWAGQLSGGNGRPA